MKNARSKALDTARQFGIVLNANITNTELQFSRERIARSLVTNMIEPIDDTLDEDDEELNEVPIELACDENAADSSNTMVDIIESDGSKRTIRKSTFLWMLADFKDKLSSDRSMRVRGSSSQNLGPPGKKFDFQKKNTPIIFCTKFDYKKVIRKKIEEYASVYLCQVRFVREYLREITRSEGIIDDI